MYRVLMRRRMPVLRQPFEEKVPCAMPGIHQLVRLRGESVRLSSRVKLSASLTVALIAAVIAGCASGAPEITPLPTSPATEQSSTPAPTPEPTSGAYFAAKPESEEEAIEQATEAYAFFLATVGEVYANPSTADRIDDIAIGSAAVAIHEAANAIAEAGADVHFADSFAVWSDQSYSEEVPGADGTTNTHGTVHLYGCLDMSSRGGTNADGSPIEQPGSSIIPVHVTTTYDAEAERWYVLDEGNIESESLGTC